MGTRWPAATPTARSGCGMSPIPRTPSALGQPLTGGGTAPVDSVAFSPDGHTLASGSDDGVVQLWDVADPAHPSPLGQPLTGGTATVNSVAFSSDGHTLASGSGDGTTRLWNLNSLNTPSGGFVPRPVASRPGSRTSTSLSRGTQASCVHSRRHRLTPGPGGPRLIGRTPNTSPTGKACAPPA